MIKVLCMIAACVVGLIVTLYVCALILALLIWLIPERNHRGPCDQGRKLT
jgi:hypothetical protein